MEPPFKNNWGWSE